MDTALIMVSFSRLVSGDAIATVTGLVKLHGLDCGSGTVPRMPCLADGKLAPHDAFPHAVFANDFFHAAIHAHYRSHGTAV